MLQYLQQDGDHVGGLKKKKQKKVKAPVLSFGDDEEEE